MQVIFHVGPHKTGSTAIQDFLQKNRTTLAGSGVYVPQSLTASPGNHEIPWISRGWDLGLIGATEHTITLDSYVRRTIDDAVASRCDVIVLSSEDFSLLDVGQWTTILKAFRAQSSSKRPASFRIVSFVRDSDQYLRSQYKTLVMLGLPDEFDEVKESLQSHLRTVHELIRALPKSLDGVVEYTELSYAGHGVIREFSKALFPDTIFVGGELPEVRVNDSFDSFAIEVMRQGNVLAGLVFDKNHLLDWPSFHTKGSARDVAERRHKLYSAYELSKSEREALLLERNGLTAERDSLASERDVLTAERDALQLERDSLTAEREAFLSSKSWRLTKPLRDIARVFRSDARE